MNPIDEAFYAMAADEIASGQVNRGIMSKAYSDSEGDEKRTKALYIKLRVAQLGEIRRSEIERLKKEAEQKQKEAEQKRREEEQKRREEEQKRNAAARLAEEKRQDLLREEIMKTQSEFDRRFLPVLVVLILGIAIMVAISSYLEK
jgi:hypothetical protein